jgi:3-dehydroquinate dehydratase/shikimate dehydrogenase
MDGLRVSKDGTLNMLAPGALCVSLTPRSLQEVFSSDLTGADCAEVRLDYLDKPQDSINVRWDRLPLPVIATCRGKERGGCFDGSVEEETRILERAVENGAKFVDIDYRSAKPFTGAQVISSFHDFAATPAGIGTVVDSACAGPGQIAKVATFVNSWADNRRLLSLLSLKWPKPVIVVGMGEIGQITRLIGPARGSYLTYAASTNASAPGQLSLREMLDVYQFRRIRSSTKLIGVIGTPEQSSSFVCKVPNIHNRAFEAMDLDFIYLKFPVPNVRDFFENARAIGIEGFSVATAHQKTVVPFVDELMADARDAGAVNTVSLRNGRWIGDNTDVAARQFEIWTGHRAPAEIFEAMPGVL